MSRVMLFRFSLYGFLKNQRYFEPFFLLILLDRGLSFTAIGFLIAFRELVVNLLEIPTGAIADVCGRRASLILSFLAYIAAFAVFAEAASLPWLYAAMFSFAVGEAFRTGTHKAMIFTWLRLKGREHERTKVYGYTRSWSQLGSAASVVVSAVFVLVSGDYASVFYLSIAPCALNIVNFLGYPREVDGERSGASLGAVVRHTWRSLRDSLRKPGLRRLVLESVGFEGTFDAVKDYLQPVLSAAALAAAAHWTSVERYSDPQRAALFIGPVYFVVFILTSLGSRHAHRFCEQAGGEERAAGRLWAVAAAVYALLTIAAFAAPGVSDSASQNAPRAAGFSFGGAAMITAFVALHVAQNVWRPILISRFDTHGSEAQGATILSIESQAQRIGTMLIAPLIGAAVDTVTQHGPGGAFWPVGAIGATIACAFTILAKSRRSRTPLTDPRP